MEDLQHKAYIRTYRLLHENCLLLGQDSRFTAKNITKAILGTRATFEIFKLCELRYSLLRIFPLIHTLFLNTRVPLELTLKERKQKKSLKKISF